MNSLQKNRLIQLGKNIRRARLRASISSDALAAAAGISAIELEQIEEGEADPDLEVLLDIAELCGIRVQELLSE